MRFAPLLALVPLLALACSSKPPAEGHRIVYEVEPEHAAAVVEVLQARLGPSTAVCEAEPGRLHVDIRKDDEEALVRRIAETPGRLRFLIAVQDAYEPPGGWRQAHDALDAWCRAHPLESLSGAPAPIAGAAWVRRPWAAADSEIEERAMLLLESSRPEWRFEAPDLASVKPGQDDFGFPGILLELEEGRQEDFGQFTKEHVRRMLAVVLDGEALVLAVINEPLHDRFMLTGGQRGFSEEDVATYVPVLRHGELPAPVKYVETRPFP